MKKIYFFKKILKFEFFLKLPIAVGNALQNDNSFDNAFILSDNNEAFNWKKKKNSLKFNTKTKIFKPSSMKFIKASISTNAGGMAVASGCDSGVYFN